jgi:hypothetical protein
LGPLAGFDPWCLDPFCFLGPCLALAPDFVREPFFLPFGPEDPVPSPEEVRREEPLEPLPEEVRREEPPEPFPEEDRRVEPPEPFPEEDRRVEPPDRFPEDERREELPERPREPPRPLTPEFGFDRVELRSGSPVDAGIEVGATRPSAIDSPRRDTASGAVIASSRPICFWILRRSLA